MSLQPITILGFDNQGGLKTYNKPFLNPDQAFQKLENAYVFRNQVKKREGIKFLGRLQRILTSQSLGNTAPGPPNTVTINDIFTTIGISGENPELNPGSLVITVVAPDTATFTDNGDGTFTVTGAGVASGSYVNYATGKIVLQFTALAGGSAITANLKYYPSLPVMGIEVRELPGINDEQTIWFDTKYAYIWNITEFEEFIPGTTWDGTNSDFFWTANYRGVNPQDRLFFVTNFVNSTGSPIRYTDGTTWTTFAPLLSSTSSTSEIVGTIAGSSTTFSGILSHSPISGSLIITVAGISFSDPTGSGTLTGNPVTNTGTINYSTGAFTLNFNPTINFTGAISNITTAANAEVTTTVNHNLTTGAEVTITGVNGMTQVNNRDFTITVTALNKFQLNFTTTQAYQNGGNWALTSDSMNVDANYEFGNNFLFQARIIIPYFGRLLALNVWEGTTVGGAVNIFNRCRFSQTGSPIQNDAWRADIFGKGGFLDAPTNEQIIGATFLNNTLIVFFEKTTWQLRYVGEYGLPFIWERIASDLGSESTFSPVLFNEHILAIGDKAIISADSNSVKRIDIDIPNQIFAFQNENNGVKRVQGIRDYQKEVVYWNYADAFTQAAPNTDLTFPNKVLIYNYRNNTWAIFRDSVTVFGTFQETTNIFWNSQVVFWDAEDVTWDDVDSQSRFPLIVSGNQEGFVNFYQIQGPQGTAVVPANEQPSLSISAISLTGSLVTLTIKNHNLLQTDPQELIYLSNIKFIDNSTFLPVATTLNDNLYSFNIIDSDTITLSRWDFIGQNYFTDFTYTPNISSSIYIGGGLATLFPVPIMQTKDFNPFQTKGLQTKLSYIDFLMDVTNQPPGAAITNATKANPCVITSANHGLFSGQSIFIYGVSGMTQLNTSMNYKITVIDANTFSINIDSTNFSTYTAGGTWILLVGGMSVQLFLNSSPGTSGNLLLGNTQLGTTGTAPFFRPFYSNASQYAWYRFYTTCIGQYFNILMTYDDNLMNTIYTHNQLLTLNAVNIWTRPGGKITF